MLKTILEIQIPREQFDKMFPDSLCALRNDYRHEEQFWGYSYNSRDDKSSELFVFAQNQKDETYKYKLLRELEMYDEIVQGRGPTSFVVFTERF